VDFIGTGLETQLVHTADGDYYVATGWIAGFVEVTATSAAFGDLPRCAKGKLSTKTAPCTK
jgi:hypothetical protein